MSNSQGAVFDFDHVAAMVNQLSDIAEEAYGLYITADGRKQIVNDVLSHYYDHVTTYGVSVTGSDPYKFLAWAGIQIFEDMKSHDKEIAIKFLSSSIAAMHRALLEEGRSLEDWYLKKIIRMVVSEYNGKNHLGLGKNGLYIAFKSASIVAA